MASTVQAFAAVIPTSVLGLYTLIVLPIQQYAEKTATSARADKAAELAKDPGKSHADIEAALAKLTQESGDWLALRWGVLILTSAVVVALAAQAARAGNKPGKARRAPVAEALAAVPSCLVSSLQICVPLVSGVSNAGHNFAKVWRRRRDRWLYGGTVG